MSDTTKRRGPKGGRERFQLVIRKASLEKVRELAEQENRSISSMLATLVDESLHARQERPNAN